MYGHINVNDTIFVELLPAGWDIIRRYEEELFAHHGEHGKVFVEEGIELYKRSTNKYLVGGEWKELTEFQLHEFMRLFGEHFVIGRLCNFIGGNNLYLAIDLSTKVPNEYEIEESRKKKESTE